jgi:hypothetical protein
MDMNRADSSLRPPSPARSLPGASRSSRCFFRDLVDLVSGNEFDNVFA